MSFFRFAPESCLVCSLVVETPAANPSSSEGSAKGSEPNELFPLHSWESLGLQSSRWDTAANLSSSEGTVKGSEPLMSFFRYAPESRLVCSLVVETPAANLSSSEETAEGSKPTASTKESLCQVCSHNRSLIKFINYCVHFIPTINGEITVTTRRAPE
jgi:hypothetical protein